MTTAGDEEAGPAVTADEMQTLLIEAARRAYEDAGLSGLCAEGRWEAALSAMRRVETARRAERSSSD